MPFFCQKIHFLSSILESLQVGGVGSCPGDSGGLIVRFVTEGGDPYYVQLGTVQGGISKCGSRVFPGIYVRTSNEDIMHFIFETSGLDKGEKQSY